MKIEFVKKELEPQLTFGDLGNGEVFKFKQDDSNHHFWMKTGSTAMRVDKCAEIIPVISTSEVVFYNSHIVIKGN